MSAKIIPYPLGKKQSVDLYHDKENESIWASQKQMAEMFGVESHTINYHVKNILEEMGNDSVTRKIRVTADDGKKYDVIHYNHETIFEVGYRCHSEKARKFKEWASRVIYHSLIKEERQNEQDSYKQLKGILKRAVDYVSNSPLTSNCFARMQNMIYYAVCGMSASGIKVTRANHREPDMGLTYYEGKKWPKVDDVTNAKKYMERTELVNMQKVHTAFAAVIDMATSGFRPQTYTMDQMLDKLEQFLIDFGQLDETGAPTPVVTPKAADDHAKRELKKYKEYRTLMEKNIPKLRRGEQLEDPTEQYVDNVMRVNFRADEPHQEDEETTAIMQERQALLEAGEEWIEENSYEEDDDNSDWQPA